MFAFAERSAIPYRFAITKEVFMNQANQKYTILYGRLSQEDDREGDSNSIQHQRMILEK